MGLLLFFINFLFKFLWGCFFFDEIVLKINIFFLVYIFKWFGFIICIGLIDIFELIKIYFKWFEYIVWIDELILEIWFGFLFEKYSY